MRDLEKLCGSTRLSLIYLGSGMVGNLASAIFVPYRAEVGPAGAHFGLLALSMVEVIHQWPSLKYPEMAILKIVGITAVLFLAGLLPWVDNYAHLFGFIFGFLLSYALQVYDYIVVNSDYWWTRCLKSGFLTKKSLGHFQNPIFENPAYH